MPGAQCTRSLVCQVVVQNAHEYSQPRRSGFFVTVAPKKLASQELDASVEASGPHDFSVRKKALSSLAPPRIHRIPFQRP
jgi:hypothetical protein